MFHLDRKAHHTTLDLHMHVTLPHSYARLMTSLCTVIGDRVPSAIFLLFFCKF